MSISWEAASKHVSEHPHTEAASLYEAHKKVYPRAVSGRFRRLKWAVMGLCLAFFYLAPLLRWNRGAGAPDQAILIDLAGRRVYLFDLEFWPQEIYLVTGIMVLAMMALFLATALFGRVWCGYACPQTVWTDLFVMVERWVEGDRMERIRLDRAPWTLNKLGKKALKHGIWLLIAAGSGCAFVGWYTDAPTLTVKLLQFSAPMTDVGFIALLTSTTYLLGGLAREQVCVYMCPWPRIQSALLDEHSRVVSYQAWRGEPRGKLADKDAGDCIDCLACVQVCPAGIDIRDGHQLACIDCSLCVDACDSMMDKVGRARGLIAWESFTGQKQRAAGQPAEWRPIRPRTVLYAVVMLVVVAAMMIALVMRQPLRIAVLHDRMPLWVTISGDRLRNGYTLKINNQTRKPQELMLTIDGPPGAELAVAGERELSTDRNVVMLTAEADGQTSYHITAALPKADVTAASTPITFRLVSPDFPELRITDHFFAPERP
jgi:cytochrome c oxidase accessory protein FixG